MLLGFIPDQNLTYFHHYSICINLILISIDNQFDILFLQSATQSIQYTAKSKKQKDVIIGKFWKCSSDNYHHLTIGQESQIFR